MLHWLSQADQNVTSHGCRVYWLHSTTSYVTNILQYLNVHNTCIYHFSAVNKWRH